MVTFQDLHNAGFFGTMDGISWVQMGLSFALSFVVGLFIFFIYKRVVSGATACASFGISLIALAMITSLVILAVTSNIVLSLGMVGALSIVRFRTAIKDPLDIVFLFWSLAVGIVLAAGLYALGVVGSACIGILLLALSHRRLITRSYLLTLHCRGAEEERRALKLVEQNTSACVLKGKCISGGMIELHYEVRVDKNRTEFVNMLSEIEGVHSVNLASFHGEYMA